ncbi:TPA: hypothetical protein ACN98A_004435 [Vibrio parahaemolyticus]
MTNFSFSLRGDGLGKIVIGSYEEHFVSDLNFWKVSDYIEHWNVAREVLTTGTSVSFITSITEPENSNFIRSWVCYYDNGELVFQEHMLFLDEPDFEFNIDEPHKNVRPYESITEEGEKISEWRIKI